MTRHLLTVICLLLALTACGRKGALEPPPGAIPDQSDQSDQSEPADQPDQPPDGTS